jgi:cyclophilin family peptidyl-prolyl cis-trans isomerase
MKQFFLCTFVAAALLGILSVVTVAAKKDNPVVVIDTSLGKIKVELNEEKAPVTVKNFLAYVDAKFYDGTLFHRVIPRFMVQGGGFEPGLKEKTTKDPIKNEAANGLSNERGTIAMARTPDPDSATAQFFINVADNKRSLDKTDDNPGYAVFGKVIEGMDVADKIVAVDSKTSGMHDHVPLEDVVINSIRRVEKK